MSGGESENVSSNDTSNDESVKMLTELAADYAEYMQGNYLKEVLAFWNFECQNRVTVNHVTEVVQSVNGWAVTITTIPTCSQYCPRLI